MTAGVPPADAAWVIVDTPLSPERLVSFCADVERLYRINPYLEVRYWRPRDAGQVEVAFRNLSNGCDVEVRCTIEKPAEDEVVVRYDRGIKSRTCFRIRPAPGGSRLTITDDYGGAAAHPANDTSEVDRSLHAWGVALRDYLLREARWARYAPWRWYMRRVWLPMKPAARRITFVILMVALAEIVLIALVMAIYWAEQLR